MNQVIVTPEELIEKVKQYQGSNRYTDEQMAGFIGCSRETYNLTKNGNMKVGNAFFYGAVRFLSSAAEASAEKRTSVINRETKETNISIELDIDGSGQYEIGTGIGMFDHMLSQLARHGRFDIKIKAAGDDQHHVAEDVAICLGQAFREALGKKLGMTRMADATVPMDDSLATVAVDISGRGYTVLDLSFAGNDMFGFPTDLIRHFLESFASEARLNLHVRVLYGSNDHHRAEALFKALGRALDVATTIDERISGELPSTKGFLED